MIKVFFLTKAASSDEDLTSDSEGDYQRFSDRRRAGAGGSKPSYVVPDTDEDVDEDTVQSWTMEGEEVEESEVITVDKVIFLQRQLLQNA